MNTIDTHQLLEQLRTLRTQAQGFAPEPGQAAPAANGFGQVFSQALSQVNAMQQESTQTTTAFERGDPNTDLASAMVAMQKASLSFQAVTQVRNKLLSAYQDIMNMPV
jgi:flagellar hook-basal body complex protein FliE